MRTMAEMETGILEAHQIRAKHDGVHAVHSYVAVMELCRDFATQGAWAPYVDGMFDEALAKLRIIARTGFAPKSSAHALPRRPHVARSYAHHSAEL